jgi:TM2 domain-containing membrane protein YozV
MKCAVHGDLDATGYCRNCGKAMCPQCTRNVNGALYCEPCLGAMLVAPQVPVVAAHASASNPGLAAVLGFIPGLGAVYNGEYVKALIQVLIFGGIIVGLASDISTGYIVFLSIALGCFYLYMPIDSYRVARARRMGEPDPGILPESSTGRPVGAIVLIVLGILFLMANFGILQEDWFSKAWPLGLIALGIWLVWDRMNANSRRT